MPVEHFLIAEQTDLETWETPAHALRVANFSVDPGRERIDLRDTGSSRSLGGRVLGAKAPTAKLEMKAYAEKLGWLLKACGLPLVTTTTPGGATNARLHTFLPDDTLDPVALSAQVQYGNSIGQNILGMVGDKLSFTAVAKEEVKLAIDFMALDEAKCGGTWDFDGVTASEALVSSPSYISAGIRPLMFFDAVIVVGGIVAKDGTTKRLSITGGTAQAKFERFEFNLENGFDLPHFLGSSPTPGQADGQDRKVNGKFDVAQSTVTTTFYDEMRAGTKAALKILLAGPIIESTIRRTVEIIFPSIDYDAAAFAGISGDQKRRTRSVEFTSVLESVTNTEIGIALIDTQTAY